MTIAELHANEELRLHEFPVASKMVFLAHGGISPLPRRVSEAMTGYNERCMLQDQEQSLGAGFFPKLREKAARLIDAQPEEIAPAFVFFASQESSYVTGEVLGVTGGRLLPS